MFEGFQSSLVFVRETSIFVRQRGKGSPVLLLHGFPETHAMWHAIAPALAEQFTVVCADLRGYGRSGKPALEAAGYAKSAMARDMVELMASIGFEKFAVAGHDRGARVAYRMALNHPDCIERLAVLDIIPTGEAFARADERFALGYWPWSLFSQPQPLPEKILAAAPEAIVEHALSHWGSDYSSFSSELRAHYVDSLRDPATVHAICNEFRAAASIDIADDKADRAANRRIVCPTLVLWGKAGPLDTWYESAGGPLEMWRNWAADVRGAPIVGGHFFPETNHAETTQALDRFLSSEAPSA